MTGETADGLGADVRVRPDEVAARAYAAAAQKAATREDDLRGAADWRPSRAGVVGAGTMGGGIAMAFANIGVPVSLVDRTQADVDRGLDRIRENYRHTVARGRLSPDEADQRLALIRGSAEFSVLSDADVVVEAVYEDLPLKQEVFTALDGVVQREAVLCTNTSGLNIDAIASVTTRPEAVIGTHFFSPANVMRLLEVVRGKQTSQQTYSRALRLGILLGKVTVPSANSPSFIGNAMLAHYSRETAFLVEEGAYPRDVDRVLEEFGFAMGLFKVGDMAGLDVGIDARRKAVLTRPKDRRYTDLKLLPPDLGRLGQKTGAGWYRYEPGSRTPLDDPEMDRAIEEYSRRIGIERRAVGDDEILARCLYALVNCGARLLGDGVAAKPSDVDAVYVTGYGFPASVGGPLFWADAVGLADIFADIERLHELHGIWWEPAPLLGELARTGRTFADLNTEKGFIL
ncbi:3-hydroxyacyl-CoA dehydrogenase NAD-binding domain-containing protein [Rhodococcus koreensis]